MAIRGFLKALILLLVVIGGLAFVIANYSWVFAKRVKGEVVDVQRVTAPTAVFGSRATEAQMYSYSILLKSENGQLFTASSEDRQWQVVKKGYCVEALLYRYPFWDLDKAGNFFNARVEQIRECPGHSSLPDSTPSGASPDVEAPGDQGVDGTAPPAPQPPSQPAPAKTK